MFLLLALAMPFFLYGKEPSIFTPTLSADALVSDDTVATTDSAGGTDLIVRPDTPEDLTVAADTLPRDVLEALLLHLQDLNATPSPARRAGGTPLLTGKTYKDQNGHVTLKETYEYDDSERQIRTISEYYDASGTHTSSSSITELGYSGNTQVFNTTFTWANNQWEGTTRSEYIYNDNNRQITNITYSWNPSYNYWTPTASTTYQYDALFRVPEQWTWTIDNATKKLKPATRTQQEWDERRNLILKVVYQGGQDANGEWLGGSGGTKNIYEYQTYGTANKKVLDEAYTWNNGWVGKANGKTTWSYTPDGSNVIEEVKYNWTSGAYTPASSKEYTYDDAKHQTSYFPYKWTNGNKIGNGTGTRTVYTGNNQDSVLTYTWNTTNNCWIMTKAVLKQTTGILTITGTLNYAAQTGIVSSGTLTYTYTHSSTASSVVTQQASAGLLVRKDSTYTVKSGSVNVLQEKYTWDATANQWIAATKTVDIRGGVVTSGTLTYTWSNGQWVLQKGTKKESSTDSSGATVSLTYNCSNDSNWTVSSGYKTTSITDADGASVSLTHTYVIASSTWKLANGTKNITFTDATGATVSLNFNCVPGTPDSTWTLKSGTRTPSNQYDADNHLVRQAAYYCSSDSIWKVSSLKTWAYDQAGHQIAYAEFKKDSVPNYRTASAYNENNKLLYQERFNYENSIWKGDFRYEYDYDDAGRTTLIIHYSSWLNNSWRVGAKDEMEFDSNGREVIHATYTWEGGVWAPIFKYISTYNATGKKDTYITQVNVNGAWTNRTKEVYTYAANGSTITQTDTYSWVNNDWLNTEAHHTQYDATNPTLLRSELNITRDENGDITSYELIEYQYSTDN